VGIIIISDIQPDLKYWDYYFITEEKCSCQSAIDFG